ncbi:uncharacterized protein LOC144457132 [Phascolarctos cinereus]
MSLRGKQGRLRPRPGLGLRHRFSAHQRCPRARAPLTPEPRPRPTAGPEAPSDPPRTRTPGERAAARLRAPFILGTAAKQRPRTEPTPIGGRLRPSGERGAIQAAIGRYGGHSWVVVPPLEKRLPHLRKGEAKIRSRPLLGWRGTSKCSLSNSGS